MLATPTKPRPFLPRIRSEIVAADIPRYPGRTLPQLALVEITRTNDNRPRDRFHHKLNGINVVCGEYAIILARDPVARITTVLPLTSVIEGFNEDPITLNDHRIHDLPYSEIYVIVAGHAIAFLKSLELLSSPVSELAA